ncbi:metalloregulator ArsR/SmtB family transcription factor [Halomonas sp. BLK-85]
MKASTSLTLTPLQLFKCLSDDTRLSLVLLIAQEGELCVCEMTYALDLSQPKVSRHLAQLRQCGLLRDQRDGQWVYYRLASGLPVWGHAMIEAGQAGEQPRMEKLTRRLRAMGDRPGRRAVFC